MRDERERLESWHPLARFPGTWWFHESASTLLPAAFHPRIRSLTPLRLYCAWRLPFFPTSGD